MLGKKEANRIASCWLYSSEIVLTIKGLPAIAAIVFSGKRPCVRRVVHSTHGACLRFPSI